MGIFKIKWFFIGGVKNKMDKNKLFPGKRKV
jgi:hypothetical protein